MAAVAVTCDWVFGVWLSTSGRHEGVRSSPLTLNCCFADTVAQLFLSIHFWFPSRMGSHCQHFLLPIILSCLFFYVTVTTDMSERLNLFQLRKSLTNSRARIHSGKRGMSLSVADRLPVRSRVKMNYQRLTCLSAMLTRWSRCLFSLLPPVVILSVSQQHGRSWTMWWFGRNGASHSKYCKCLAHT